MNVATMGRIARPVPSLLDNITDLPEEVKDVVRSSDWQTFILALVVLIGGGYALVFGGPNVSGDVRLAVAGYIGSVIVYFFGRNIATNAAANMTRSLIDNAPAPTPTAPPSGAGGNGR